jgi:transposase
MELRASGLESLLPEGHRVRLVWAYVERQDLKGFYEDNRAVEGGVGRSAIAPEILLGLWLYATLDGVGSAQEITRLTEAHDAYCWLCSGAQVNDHTLSDFRTDHGEALGDHVHEYLIRNKREEWDAFKAYVSPFELERYLPIL